jgi:hypothetical protein
MTRKHGAMGCWRWFRRREVGERSVELSLQVATIYCHPMTTIDKGLAPQGRSMSPEYGLRTTSPMSRRDVARVWSGHRGRAWTH